jgi:hypothetical protein
MMNKRQQKQYDQITKFLEQYGAKFKEGTGYEHSEKNIVIINKYNIEKIVLPGNCIRLKANNEYWTFDGVMNDRQKNEFKIIKGIAESKGGKLLSTVYVDCDTALEFLDKDGNHFKKPGKEIKNYNKWSPFENGRVMNNPEYHLNELRKIAESKGGKLISTEYTNGRTKLEVEDKNGMRFFMSGTDLRRNHWSPFESNTVRDSEYHLNLLREIAKNKGGKLISTQYLGAKIKLEFEDSQQRRFFMTPDDVKGTKGRWSGYESGNVYNNPEYHLNILREIAKNKGGKLISTQYINGRTKLEFENIFGRRFYLTPNQVKKGVWSHFEVINISEERCRQCIEFIFGEEFPNIWGVIKNPKTNRGMQFDGYNENFRIAFEYQGEQHYSWENCRGKTEEKKKQNFIKNLNNDEIKFNISKKESIKLITIKYFENYKEDKQYLEHVIKELKLLNDDLINICLSNIKNKLNEFKIDYSKFPTNEKYLEPLRKIAASNGGKLISTQYIDNNTKLEFEDKNGNRFFRKPGEIKDIKNPRWSPFEVQKIRVPEYQFKKIKDLIESNGGKLISKEYINANTKIEFEDRNGKVYAKKSCQIKKHNFA